MTPRLVTFVVATVWVLPIGPALAADYYVRPAGADGNSGLSPDAAWRSIARVNKQDLEPGDRILLEGGETFSGPLLVVATDAGTAASPVVITSFGTGRATIDGGTGRGIDVYNAGGIEIRDLDVMGSGMDSNSEPGVSFYTDHADGSKLDHVRIDRVDVHGFREGGVVIGAWHPSRPGFRDVRITHTRAFGNGESGVHIRGFFDGTHAWSHEDVYIGYSEAFDNFGDPTNIDTHTGSGIIVSATNRATIEYCHAHHNGGNNRQPRNGPVGIWAWDANAVTIQHNISHDNRTGGEADGGGFDLDGGVTNSVLQYNYSYDNDGAGYLLAQFAGAAPFFNNVVRYNVSSNDGRQNGHGAISLWAAANESLDDTQVYGNTVFVSPAASRTPSAVWIKSGTFRHVTFRNNIFVTTGGVTLLDDAGAHDLSSVGFQGNAYWPSESSFGVRIGGVTHASLASWQSATGQEKVRSNPVGLETDPLLVDPSNPQRLTDPTQLPHLAAYRLQEESPVIDAGLDLRLLFGTDPGRRDFYGVPIPQHGGLDIGASERAPFSERFGARDVEELKARMPTHEKRRSPAQ